MSAAVRQVNVLAWLEGVCGDADAAAVLLNSALGALLVRLLAAAPAPGLRARLASVLGLLVRHTAFVGPDLAACGDARHSTMHKGCKRAAGVHGAVTAPHAASACPSRAGSSFHFRATYACRHKVLDMRQGC